MLRPVLVVALASLVLAGSAAAAVRPPPGWPSHLAVGAADRPGGAASLARLGRVDMRYQYLTGGVDTGNGWAGWNPDGTFVSRYMAESRRAGLLPVFTWYQVLLSRPGRAGDEGQKDLANIADPSLTRQLFADFRLLLRRIGHRRAVVHVEPDLWGYVQLGARRDDAATVPAAVASSGDPAARGLPNTAAGFARVFVRLRNRIAPRVILAWHLSSWGTNRGLNGADPGSPAALGRRSARFYRSLHARFDVVFNDVADRDDGWRVHVNGERVSQHHFEPDDFARHDAYVRTFTRATRTPVALWQLPVGSSGLPDTWERFRDNRLEWWLAPGAAARAHLRRTARAGVIGLLFGAGAEGCTTPRTDGGVFFSLASAYARRPLAL